MTRRTSLEHELSKARPNNAADFGQFGNAAAMREAVVLALSLLDLKEGVPYKTISQKDIDFMKAALSAPRRNCDVGTAKEQAERYSRYCDQFIRDGLHCEKCPCCGKIPFGRCEFAWMQMPYKEGGAK